VRKLVAVYAAEMRFAMANQAQYRFAAFFQLVGFLIEPVVYLVVWRTVAEQGGPVGGYGVAEFTAYYIVWTLVRNMNLALAPGAWDWWIQSGRISNDLMHPVAIYHRQIASFAGFKFFWIILWFPVAGVLSWLFKPEFHPTLLQGVAFAVAIWLGYVIRFSILFLMGLISFWTTRAQALIEIVIAAELLLSGRLVPLSVMPRWVEHVAAWLPFKWTFQYPIETLIGQLSDGRVLEGLGLQLLWIGLLVGLILLVWRRAIRRYTAVGS
jgi:ABC-2 type transport system permease protein